MRDRSAFETAVGYVFLGVCAACLLAAVGKEFGQSLLYVGLGGVPFAFARILLRWDL